MIQTLWNKLANELEGWLLNTYECMNTPEDARPTESSEPYEHTTLTFKYEAPLKTVALSTMQDALDTVVYDVGVQLKKQIDSLGIKQGDKLYIVQWPMVVDLLELRRNRMCGCFGDMVIINEKGPDGQ